MQKTDINNIAVQKLLEYSKISKLIILQSDIENENCFYISNEPYEEGCVTVNIKKTRSILYYELSIFHDEMPSYEIYVLRYLVNITTGNIKRIEDKVIYRKVDLAACVRFEIKDRWSIYVIGSHKGKNRTIVLKFNNFSSGRRQEERFKAPSDARDRISEIVSEFFTNKYFYNTTLKEMTDDQKQSFKKMLSNELYNRAADDWYAKKY